MSGVAAPSDTLPLEGVQLVHEVPAGIACVRDQITASAPADGHFEALFTAAYDDAAVAQALVDANQLAATADGPAVVYVPAGLPVLLPAMCYVKEGAPSVDVAPPDVGAPSGDDHTASTWTIVVLVLLTALVVVGIRKLVSS